MADLGNYQDGLSRSATGVVSSRAAGVADHLQHLILDGNFKRGDSLPSERELMSQFLVSRATVREALRVLSAQGLIEVKRGRNGGSYILGADGVSLSKSLDMFIRGSDIRYVDLLAVRDAIEPTAAGQAAVYRTEADPQKLHDLSLSCEHTFHDIDEFSNINMKWHMTIIDASHNPLFKAFMSSISSVFYSATNREEFDINTRKVVVGTHWQIYRAIQEGDSDAAQRRMRRHVSAYAQRLSP